MSLEDGDYNLTATVNVSDGFEDLEMYAKRNGEKASYKLLDQDSGWTQIELKNIKVQDGKVEIGFWADGAAGSQLLVDDVSLVRKN